MLNPRILWTAAVATSLALGASAQTPPEGPGARTAEDTWGIQDDSFTVLGAAEFLPRSSSAVTYSFNTTTGFVHADGTGYTMVAPLAVPNGVMLKDMLVVACDDDGTDGFSVILSECVNLDANCAFDVDFSVASGDAAMPGCAYFAADPPAAKAMQTWPRTYFVSLSTGGTTKIRSVAMRWQRRVTGLSSGVVIFNDVLAGHPYKQYIDALGTSGISMGCGGGKYCPDNPVTRGQLAVFLARALGLYFPDVVNP